MLQHPIFAVVPAAGIGARMGSEIPKQYLSINNRSIIEYALEPLLANRRIERVVVALSNEDHWFGKLAIANHPKLTTVIGGGERANSVLNALSSLPQEGFVLVHDGARPCLTSQDIDLLIDNVTMSSGALLGSLVRDTMKRVGENGLVHSTVSRERLYHALTPQIFPTVILNKTIISALNSGVNVTDEASAMEWQGMDIKMLEGRSDNIKVTRPEDMRLAEIFLKAQQRIQPQQEMK